jgi:hypothetical protein
VSEDEGDSDEQPHQLELPASQKESNNLKNQIISTEPKQSISDNNVCVKQKAENPATCEKDTTPPPQIRITSPSRVLKMQKSLKKMTVKKRNIYKGLKSGNKIKSMPIDSDNSLPKAKISDSNLTTATQETGHLTQRKQSFKASHFNKSRAKLVKAASKIEKSTFYQSGREKTMNGSSSRSNNGTSQLSSYNSSSSKFPHH